MKETLERKIKVILETYPKCRDDNNILINQMLISIYGLHQRSHISAYKALPPIESIMRTRRAVQNKYEHLQPTKPVQLKRKRAERDYKKKYAKK